MKVREFLDRSKEAEEKHWLGIVYLSASLDPNLNLNVEEIKELDLEAILDASDNDSELDEPKFKGLKGISAEIRELMKRIP